MPVPICLDDEHYIQANGWVIHACLSRCTEARKATSELVYMYFDGVKGIVENDITKARNLCENVAAAKKSDALLMLGIM